MIELLVRVGSGQRSPNRVGHTHVTMPPARLLVDSAHIKKKSNSEIGKKHSAASAPKPIAPRR